MNTVRNVNFTTRHNKISNGVKATAIVPAAGKGERMQKVGSKEKPYLSLGDRPILAHTLAALERCEAIEEIVVVVSASGREICQREVIDRYDLVKVKKLVGGGPTRSDSVYNGLKGVDRSCELVLIHDGMRPFVTEDMVSRVVEGAAYFGACILAVRLIPTIKEVRGDLKVARTLARDRLWAVQTPQAFRRDLILAAYEAAGQERNLAPDDSMLVERLGHQVKVIEGSSANIKITTPEDMVVAEALLKQRGNE